ncbi:hypothetical protein A5745_08595 [Mycobacterium sp. IS-2888]|nr:hypothetical protein A5744_22790 [Mycobacterium sp. IS-1264]OMC48711.1 hypothetical protein A5745_08595 [Mycobacterium sp. IS-2888]
MSRTLFPEGEPIMTTYEIDWHWWHGWGGNGWNHTIDVNIAPAWVGAQVWLHGYDTSGGAAARVAISHYRKRLESGADEDHDLGGWLSQPPVIFDFISSVTADLSTGSDAEAWAVLRMDYWG